MISVIVYGRNDDRGYGMTKRVAISLNSLAQQIDGGTSELLFVDYNTPDHLPTLPELIWDTLTQQTRNRLRILRVRPAAHARFADSTPLPVIESVARNVALRRSRPTNQWILSTNTDALLVSRGPKSLLKVVETLPGGQFGLPRFELPERCWEGFVRNDPISNAALAQAWGSEARLREIVHGVAEVAFDNPGDFQLFQRDKLMKIGGFEEEMRQAWHIDHNLAKRLALLVGPIRSLEDQFELYHLGHGRNTVATHSLDRIENDVSMNVAAVEDPTARHDASGWGLADVQIEEIRLDTAPGEIVRAACRDVMLPLGEAPLKASYTPDSFDSFDFDAGHATAYLLDLLSTYPPRTIFSFAGGRIDLLTMLREGLARLGFSRRLLIPASLGNWLQAEKHPDLQVGDDDAVLEVADVMIFAFGSDGPEGMIVGDDAGAESESINDHVARLFERAAAIEENARRFGKKPRMFAMVGMVHTRYEQRLAGRIATNINPYSTRIRYGHLASVANAASPLPRPAQKLPASAHKWLAILARGDALAPAQRFRLASDAEAIRAALTGPDGSQPTEEEAQKLARLEALLGPPPELLSAIVDGPVTVGELTGPARGASWNEAGFAAEAARISTTRNGWTWERTRLLTGLAELGVKPGQGDLLVVIERDEPFLNTLAQRWDNLHVIDTRRLADANQEDVDQRPFFRHRAVEIGLNGLTKPRYQAIISPHSALFSSGVGGVGRKLLQLQRALVPGGILGIGGEISLLEREKQARPTRAVAGADGFSALLAKSLGLDVCQPGDWGLRRYDLARVGDRENYSSDEWLLGLKQEDDVLWPAVWFFRKTSEAINMDENQIDHLFCDLQLGEQIGALRLGGGAQRDGALVKAGRQAGHVVFGPFLKLTPGRYRAQARLSKPSSEVLSPQIVVEAALGETIVKQEAIGRNRQRQDISVDLDFNVPTDAGPCELRVWSDGTSDFQIESFRLNRTTETSNARTGFLRSILERPAARALASDSKSATPNGDRP